MTILECITRVDSVKPNAYTVDEKVRWLSYLDGSIKAQIIDTHEPNLEEVIPVEETEGESEGTENEETVRTLPYSCDRLTDELLVPFPYDELYTAYLKAKIDEENGETVRYNNTASTFNQLLSEYARAYHREHMPKKNAVLKYV